MVRWHYLDPPLLWLLPASYAVHIGEELWAGDGFPAWFARIAGAPLPIEVFILLNTVAWLLIVLGTWWAARDQGGGAIAITIAAILFLNALLHALGTVVTRAYSPGLISGIVLYVPIGLLILIRAWFQASRPMFWNAIGAALALHGLVIAIALSVS